MKELNEFLARLERLGATVNKLWILDFDFGRLIKCHIYGNKDILVIFQTYDEGFEVFILSDKLESFTEDHIIKLLGL